MRFPEWKKFSSTLAAEGRAPNGRGWCPPRRRPTAPGWPPKCAPGTAPAPGRRWPPSGRATWPSTCTWTRKCRTATARSAPRGAAQCAAMSHTLTAPCAHQEDIKKSRFAAFAAPVSTVDEAMRFFAANSDPEATTTAGPTRSARNTVLTMTASRAARRAGRSCRRSKGRVDRVAVLVVRWFGGVKLGAGGLVRLRRLRRQLPAGGRTDRDRRSGHGGLPVRLCRAALLKSRLAGAGAVMLHEDYGADGVALRFTVPRAVVASLR